MKIIVTGAEARFATTSRDDVVRRVLLALSRFSPRLQKVTVHLAEPANALGGVDQRCRLRASLSSMDGVRAEAINGTVEVAVTRAAAQLAKRVAFVLDGHPRHGSSATIAPSLNVNARPPPAPRRLAVRPRRRSRSR